MYFYTVFTAFFQQIFSCKNLVHSWFSCSKSCLVFTNYMIICFLSLLLRTVVSIFYPVHNNDIPLSLWHCIFLPLFLYIGTIIFVFHSIGTFCSIHILLIKLCGIFVNSCPHFFRIRWGCFSTCHWLYGWFYV